MKSLEEHLSEYVAARRALGTRLKEPARTLKKFLNFLYENKLKYITTKLALAWSQQSLDVQRATWARKLSMVRQFARWMNAIDDRHQIPPSRLLNVRHRRNKPHIYTDEQLRELMEHASKLKSSNGIKALTLEVLIGLMAATGLRPGEAAFLKRKDVDFAASLLVIRESKFGKSRLVPIHQSTVLVLEEYAKRRDQIFPTTQTQCFFVNDAGTSLSLLAVRRWFCKISVACDIRESHSNYRCGRGPRLQDLRHTFATKRLINWYKAGENVICQMPKLSTYLGHVSVESTYWYIEAVPELLNLATDYQMVSEKGPLQ